MSVWVKSRSAGRALGVSVAAVALLWATPSLAQQAAGAPTAPSDSAMVNLVRMLVEQGVLTPEKGNALMAQAQAEATQVRAASAQTAAGAGQQGGAMATLTPPPAGTVRVPYVPETVRAQIKDELRQEVLAQAKEERWAAPDQAAPSWINNVRIHGDLRIRSASSFYSKNNSDTIIDIANWNPTGPIDVRDGIFPILNATNNRINTAQIRARVGVEATVANRFKIGFQLATGDNNGPVSTNAILGGGFQKRDIWLQNAYVRGEMFRGVTAMLGRFDNPMTTTDLMFDPDLAFDGVYGEVDFGKVFRKDFGLTVRGGAFPINFGDNNFPSTAVSKRNFRDQYLYSAQIEADRTFGKDIEVKLAGAYHNFTYLRGHVSDPCDVYFSNRVECSTDALAPAMMAKGNSWMFLRSFDFTAPDDPSNPSQPQLIGYKFGFRILDINGSVNVPVASGVYAKLTGNYLHNFGFNPKYICQEGAQGAPQNNYAGAPGDFSSLCDKGTTNRFLGGGDGWGVYFSLGHPELFSVNPGRAHRGDWAVNAAYKYLQSDAVPAIFTDSDFHLGGTNAKGYIIGGAYALFDGLTISGRWLSSNQIVGEPLAIDVLHLDLGVAF